MTDTPLTRAARALMLSQSGVDDFDALDDEMQAQVIKDVRAVLGAVREPSEAMDEAGDDMLLHRRLETRPTPLWQAMIDAALSE